MHVKCVQNNLSTWSCANKCRLADLTFFTRFSCVFTVFISICCALHFILFFSFFICGWKWVFFLFLFISIQTYNNDSKYIDLIINTKTAFKHTWRAHSNSHSHTHPHPQINEHWTMLKYNIKLRTIQCSNPTRQMYLPDDE